MKIIQNFKLKQHRNPLKLRHEAEHNYNANVVTILLEMNVSKHINTNARNVIGKKIKIHIIYNKGD